MLGRSVLQRTPATTLFAHIRTRRSRHSPASESLVASTFLGLGRLQWALMKFKRITTDARQMGGVPCLRGLRIPVATIVSLVAEGETVERILALYPDLEADDVREALFFAAEAVRERTLPLAAGQ